MKHQFGRMVLIVFVVSMVWAGSTAAWAGPEEGDVAFEQLTPLVTESNQLRIHYGFDDRSWAQFIEREVAPQLVVYMRDDSGGELGYAYAFHLTNQQGSMTFPNTFPADRIEEMHLELKAHDGSWRVRTMEVGGIRGWRLAFESRDEGFRITGLGPVGEEERMGELELVEDESRGRHRRRQVHRGGARGWQEGQQRTVRSEQSWGREERHERRGGDRRRGWREESEPEPHEESHDDQSRVAVIEACNEAMRRSSQRESCREAALEIPPSWAVPAVEACEEANRNTSDRISCLELAQGYEYSPPAEAIEACADANRYASDRRQCVEQAANFQGFSTAPVIEACDEAFRYTSDRQQCMDQAVEYESDPAAIIEACGEAGRVNSDRHECVEAGAHIADGSTSIIEACSGSGIGQCIRQATGQ